LKEKLQIAVRDLVAHTLRSGDLSSTFTGASRTLDAIRAHQKVQKSRPPGYEAELTVAHLLETDALLLEISGRIDGVYKGNAFTSTDSGSENFVLIEEIKTTTDDPGAYESSDQPLHWAQAKVYAYIYATANKLEQIDIQLTYYQLDTGRVAEIRRRFTLDDLSGFFHVLVEKYLAWAMQLVSWRRLRDNSIENLGFPFSGFRPGQREMAVAVFKTIRHKQQLLVQAPTGIGKTMAVLYPAIKALGSHLTEKLFYLTARTTARTVAEKAIVFLGQQGLRIKALTLTAKDKICFSPESACNAEECPYAKGHFDRVGDATVAIFTDHDQLTRKTVENVARAYRICPFEFSLDLTQFSDVIICDYNYAFDPRVYLRRFFAENGGTYTFLVDEAHNLVNRSREMFSAQILKQSLLDLRKRIQNDLPSIYKTLGQINTALVKIRKKCETSGSAFAEPNAPMTIAGLLAAFHFQTQRWLARNIATEFREKLLDVYLEVSAFLNILEGYDDCYVTCAEAMGKDLRLKLFCMDPARQMKAALARCQSVVFFSATLSPANYFKHLFGCGNEARFITLSSPFPSANFCLLMAPTVTTRYRRREESLTDLIHMINAIISGTPGNHLIFFPSYEYLTMARKAFSAAYPETELIVQAPGMSESDRNAFLERFSKDNTRPLAGFAVMGGIFGEGIDLEGERLSGAVIIGVGLPGISLENTLIRDYFNRLAGTGFEYASLYPGINRVLQAAGRVIRSETDRGAVLLMDERYATSQYRSLLPAHWHPIQVKNKNDIAMALASFWRASG
jgi:DNA excision repair protein ERCC-2